MCENNQKNLRDIFLNAYREGRGHLVKEDDKTIKLKVDDMCINLIKKNLSPDFAEIIEELKVEQEI